MEGLIVKQVWGPRAWIVGIQMVLASDVLEDFERSSKSSLRTAWKWVRALLLVTFAFLGERRMSECAVMKHADFSRMHFGLKWVVPRSKNDPHGQGHVLFLPRVALRRFFNVGNLLDTARKFKRVFVETFGWEDRTGGTVLWKFGSGSRKKGENVLNPVDPGDLSGYVLELLREYVGSQSVLFHARALAY